MTRLQRAFRWYVHCRIAGVVVFAAGASYLGLGVAQAVAPAGTAKATITHTNHELRVVTHTRFVTLHVKGRVLRRYGRVVVVYVPRTIFHTHTTPSHRIVVPAHVVRIRRRPATPLFPTAMTSFVIGVAPPPVTIEVPVTVTITTPGPVTTEYVPTTITETLPAVTVTGPTITIFTTDPGTTIGGGAS